MESLFNHNRFQEIYPSLNFPNRLHQVAPNYILFSGHFLFRFDGFRLIAFRLQRRVEKPLVFPENALSSLVQSGESYLYEDQLFTRIGKKKQSFIAEDPPFSFYPLSLLKQQPIGQCTLSASDLIQTLSTIQRRAIQKGADLSTVTACFDLERQSILVPTLAYEKKTVIKGSWRKPFSFSLLFLMDALAFLNHSHTMLSFRVFSHYCIIQYEDYLYAMLTFKRERKPMTITEHTYKG